MPDAFVYDLRALQGVETAIAGAMDDFGQEAAALAYLYARHKTNRYRSGISASTYLRDRLVGGKALRNRTKFGSKHDILTIVFTPSSKGLWLERGTKEHWIPIHSDRGLTRRIHHPGSRAFPHFQPAAMASISRAAPIIMSGLARRMK